ncbi:uncharacterized protein LOC103316538 isoform X2 [Nasonia vitripennis]|uniref:Uncharacterized protein n=1 Tax=Nasonia vitripennis TaxID=7425 RepID=A0A7M7HCQ8_NASVI|nr:uncharacterized protein LOC103316538 isoform X2 [Nasonia vitripennis]
MFLIECIEKRPLLYDKSDDSFGKVCFNQKDEILDQIAYEIFESLGIMTTGETVKKMWAD